MALSAQTRRLPWIELILAIAAPVVFFTLFEVALIILGVQPASHREDPYVGFASGMPLFVPQSGTDGLPVLATASNKRGFFNFQTFPAEKPPGTFRIFCLGGSTTYGRPYDDRTSFPGWLRALLPSADPSRSWEVINAGGISYASYRVAKLIEELVDYDPDLFIIYSGHNEFLEERTYGSLRETPAIVKSATEVLSRTRTWAAFRWSLRQVIGGREDSTAARTILPDQVQAKLDHSAGLELYQRDDSLRNRILEHYAISLERAMALGKSAGAQVLLVTPASNLKDFSPFKSQHSDEISGEAASQALIHVENARREIRDESWRGAQSEIDLALQMDPRFAESHYLLGKALAALAQTEDAEDSFKRARDEDVCPLRALTPMREIVLRVADRSAALSLDYVGQLEERLERQYGLRIPGAESFLDHVHPTIRENRELALLMIETLISEGIVGPAPSWGEVAIDAVTLRVESAVDPSFHARALANLSLTLNWAGKNEDSRRLAFQALDLGFEDPTILLMVARHYAIEGESARALEYLRRAVRANPQSPVAHFQLGLLFAGQGDLEAAAGHFFLSTLIWPDNDKAHQQLGFVMARKGRSRMALESYLKAQKLNPGHSSLEARITQLRQNMGDRDAELPPVELSVTRHDSGAAHIIAQTRADPSGKFVPDGIWTEWTESAELVRYLDFEQGEPIGPERTWSVIE